jgi:hypothetical protein
MAALFTHTFQINDPARLAAIQYVAAKNGASPEDYISQMVDAVGDAWEMEYQQDQIERVVNKLKLVPAVIAQVEAIVDAQLNPGEPTADPTES